MRSVRALILAVLLTAAAFAGCTPNAGEAAAGDRLSVVTTIFPLYDFARAVAGEEADVAMLIDPGTEVHTFDPTPEDIIKIQNCDVFIHTGGENDAWVQTVLASMDLGDKQVVRMMDAVTPVVTETVAGMQHDEHDDAHDEAEEEPGRAGEYDEHIWTSPPNAMRMVNAIADAMSNADTANADTYRHNAADYAAQISEVHARIRRVVDGAEHRLIVVADRFPFRYLADEYGLEYSAAFSGCSAESDVSVGTLTHLIDTVKTQGISNVFYIELSNKKVAEAVAEQTGAGMLLLHSCHNVTKQEFDAGVTYVSLMGQNADNLKKGLN